MPLALPNPESMVFNRKMRTFWKRAKVRCLVLNETICGIGTLSRSTVIHTVETARV